MAVGLEEQIMAMPVLELEGTWEEIAARAAEFAGRRVRLTVFLSETEATEDQLPPANRRMLEWLDKWECTPLTPEEREVLDGLEKHLAEYPFNLRQIEDPE
jgi:hypothetical protein